MIPLGQDWPASYIRAVLEIKGTTMETLSEEEGWKRHTLRNVLYRHWPKGEQVIAEKCGVSPDEIWPSRYRIGAMAMESGVSKVA